MSSSALKPRFDALMQLDVGKLLEVALAQIEIGMARVTTHGEAERQLAAWEDALGRQSMEWAPRMFELRATSEYSEAAKRFRAANPHRESALAHLEEAITHGSEREVMRWRWAGRAYGRAIVSFVKELGLEIEARAAEASLGPDREERLRPHPVLSGIFQVYHPVLSSPDLDAWGCHLHAAQRAATLLDAALHLQQGYAALLAEQHTLQRIAAAHGVAERATALERSEPLLPARVRALRGLVRVASAERLHSVAAAVAKNAQGRLAPLRDRLFGPASAPTGSDPHAGPISPEPGQPPFPGIHDHPHPEP